MNGRENLTENKERFQNQIAIGIREIGYRNYLKH